MAELSPTEFPIFEEEIVLATLGDPTSMLNKAPVSWALHRSLTKAWTTATNALQADVVKQGHELDPSALSSGNLIELAGLKAATRLTLYRCVRFVPPICLELASYDKFMPYQKELEPQTLARLAAAIQGARVYKQAIKTALGVPDKFADRVDVQDVGSTLYKQCNVAVVENAYAEMDILGVLTEKPVAEVFTGHVTGLHMSLFGSDRLNDVDPARGTLSAAARLFIAYAYKHPLFDGGPPTSLFDELLEHHQQGILNG